MATKWNRFAILIFIFILLATACVPAKSDDRVTAGVYILNLDVTQPVSDRPENAKSAQIEAATATLGSSQTLTAPDTPTSTSLPTPDKPTSTVVSQSEATQPEATEPSCINKAEFVKHLNISDNTVIKPGASFGKVWLIRNSGSCTWTEGYQLVFSNGDAMQGDQNIELVQVVPPGEELEVRVSLVAPTEENTYIGEWMLQDEFGVVFGIGVNGDEPLRVQIVVRAPIKYDGL